MVNCSTSGLTLIVSINRPQCLHFPAELMLWNRHSGWKNEQSTAATLEMFEVYETKTDMQQEEGVIKATVGFCTEGGGEAQSRGGLTSWRLPEKRTCELGLEGSDEYAKRRRECAAFKQKEKHR